MRQGRLYWIGIRMLLRTSSKRRRRVLVLGLGLRVEFQCMSLSSSSSPCDNCIVTLHLIILEVTNRGQQTTHP